MDWAEECDVLVVGSGAGGCCGAYTAAREGLSVILVEASEQFGGTTSYSGGGGMWFPTNAKVSSRKDWSRAGARVHSIAMSGCLLMPLSRT